MIYGTECTSLPWNWEAKNDGSKTMTALLAALNKVLPVPPMHWCIVSNDY